MSELQEWVITLHRKEDLESFYDDMETPGGNLYIPNRSVEVANKRPISRNTHYILDDDEATMVLNDARVWDVVTLAELEEHTPEPCGFSIDNGIFSKSSIANGTHINWGLLRHTERQTRAGWSSGDSATEDIVSTSSGKNVDVLIVDGHIEPSHPEMAHPDSVSDYVDTALANNSSNGAVFDRQITARGLKMVVAGAVGGQSAVPDAWAEKTAKMVTLLIDPTYPLINTDYQINLIKTLQGDTGTVHAGLPAVQRIAYGAGSEYSPNFLTDVGAAQYAGYVNFLDSHVHNDMVWYANISGPSPSVGDRDIEELVEHLMHTIHLFGVMGAVPGSETAVNWLATNNVNWQTTELHLAMKEAIDGGFFDPSGYASDWATVDEAAEVAYKEYMYLVNWSMWDMSTFWDGGSLAPEWSDSLKTPAGMLANNPKGYALFKSYFQPVLSKPDFDVLRDIFRNNDAGPSYYTPASNGASRVKQINWFSHGGSGTYDYTPYINASNPVNEGLSSDNNHGAHCAGTVAGNTQGWARNSDIYNISPYSSNPNGNISSTMWDYIREWHNTKRINPATGRRNPTVSNHSYGSGINLYRDAISYSSYKFPYSITYRGTTTAVNQGDELTAAQLEAAGLNVLSGTFNVGGTPTVLEYTRIPYYDTARFADIQDAIDDGIIVVYAAGNDNNKITIASDVDYNNQLTLRLANLFDRTYTYMKGSASGQGVDNSIVVGALETDDRLGKAYFSNYGSAVDIFAAGMTIQSSVNDRTFTSASSIDDPRDSNYDQAKYQGTSMAAPQVTGILALMAESWQDMSQQQANDWLKETAVTGNMYDSGTPPTSSYALDGANDAIAYWKNLRPDTGAAYPFQKKGRRKETSITYPRPKIRHRG
jgi:hypothetical protein